MSKGKWYAIHAREPVPPVEGDSTFYDPNGREWPDERAWLDATEDERRRHRSIEELGHEQEHGVLFHNARCLRCGLMIAYLMRDQVKCCPGG